MTVERQSGDEREAARLRLLEKADRDTRGMTHDGSDAGTAHWWVRVRYDDLMVALGGGVAEAQE